MDKPRPVKSTEPMDEDTGRLSNYSRIMIKKDWNTTPHLSLAAQQTWSSVLVFLYHDFCITRVVLLYVPPCAVSVLSSGQTLLNVSFFYNKTFRG